VSAAPAVALLLLVVAHTVSAVEPLLLVAAHAASGEGSSTMTPEQPVAPVAVSEAVSEMAPPALTQGLQAVRC
jgi:hypothetical protein